MINSKDSIVEIKDVALSFHSKKIGTVQALRGISFSLDKGGSLALVGESGSGKTTVLRCLTGLEKPDSGKVSVLGKDPFSCSMKELFLLRQKCGYIPQDPYGCIPPTLGAREAAAEPYLIVNGRNQKQHAYKKAENLLSELGLKGEKLWNSRIRTTLSGGQRQRVSVARALMLNPLLLMADEPTSMQDASTRGDILEILTERVKKGMSMIFVTHDLFLAKIAASNTMVMYRGCMCEYGRSGEILREPLHPYTKALYAALPRIGGSIKAPEKVLDGQVNNPEGCPFLGTCPYGNEKCLKMPPVFSVNGRKVACWKYRY